MSFIQGKSSNYHLNSDSYYYPKNLDYRFVNPLGLPATLEKLLDALNDVERFLGLTVSEWTTELGNPRKSFHPHYFLNIGGSEIGTFREAIDRVREEGLNQEFDSNPWDWKFAPTKTEWTDDFSSPRNILSNNICHEYFLALGRVVDPSSSGHVSATVISFLNRTDFMNPETGIISDVYATSAPYFSSIKGEHLNQTVFDFENYWSTAGYYNHSLTLNREPWHYPYTSEETNPSIVEINDYYRPGIVPKINNTNVDMTSINQGYMLIWLFRQDEVVDIENAIDLESFEEQYSNLWHLSEGEEIDVDNDFEISDPVDDGNDIAFEWSILQLLGPNQYASFQDLTDGVYPIKDFYSGDFEMQFSYDGISAPSQFDEFGGLNLTEKWRVAGDGLDQNVSINSSLWEHNVANRERQPNIDFGSDIPERFNLVTMPSIINGYQNNDRIETQSGIGTLSWRSSDINPLLNTPMDDSLSSPDLATITDPEEIQQTILERLSGNSSEFPSPIFDPATQTPRKYFWVFSELINTDNFCTTFRSGDNFKGYNPSHKSQFDAQVSNPKWKTRDSLEPNELYWQQYCGAAMRTEGYFDQTRIADLHFPQLVAGTRKQWLIWDSAFDDNNYSTGDDLYSPFQECVNRFSEE